MELQREAAIGAALRFRTAIMVRVTRKIASRGISECLCFVVASFYGIVPIVGHYFINIIEISFSI